MINLLLFNGTCSTLVLVEKVCVHLPFSMSFYLAYITVSLWGYIHNSLNSDKYATLKALVMYAQNGDTCVT